ncbi:MAG: hypothetical protein K8R23_14735 [Chthoniobacter sp.]|nr:hypothetical protein [Chthoniobacter sp.]
MQFIRFVPAVAFEASSVTVAIQPALLNLFPTSSAFGYMRDGWTDEPFVGEVDMEITELAYSLRISPADLPGSIPWLGAKWIHQRATFSPPPRAGRPRVGLIWATIDSHCPVPPHQFAPQSADFRLQLGGRARARWHGCLRAASPQSRKVQ